MRSVDTEAFCVLLAIKDDKTRKVLGIYDKATESAIDWGEMLNEVSQIIDLDRNLFPDKLICLQN